MDASTRWWGAYAYARRQGCELAAAGDYADRITSLAAAGHVTRGMPHAPLYAAWLSANGG